jgi:sensor histidine kinase YesM
MKPYLTPLQRVLLYLAGWGVVLALFSAIMRQMAAPNWPIAVRNAATYLLPAVMLWTSYWIFVAHRLRWERMGWLKLTLTELGIGLSFSGLWHAGFYALLWLLAGRDIARDVLQQAGGWQLLFGLLIYGLYAAVYHAMRIFGRLREKEIAAAESESLRVHAEMAALRGQLDPHFLFNSLHSITALVRSDPPRAEEALLQFSGLLRRVLAVKRESSDEVSLADEMAFVDDYLAIEHLRLGQRLRVQREISAEAASCRLPVFSVQALLENAIRHAIAPRRDGGTITIHGKVQDGILRLTVADDGPGADPAAVSHAPGVGLSVVRQRLQLRYGDRANFHVETAPGQGFRVTLALPATPEESVA